MEPVNASPAAEEKRRLRRKARETLSSLSAGYRERADAEILRRLLRLPEYKACGILLLYVSMPGEPDTRRLLELALRDGKRVAAPLCPAGREMEFRLVPSPDRLSPGAYGILEPPAGAEKPALPGGAANTALAVVPGLCFDRSCMRLGRGKGYYDRFLAGFHGPAVGLCYGAALASLPLPRESFDLPVSMVVTEKEILYNSGRGGSSPAR